MAAMLLDAAERAPVVSTTKTNTAPESALSFFRVVGYLKNVPRTGWVNHGVAKAESVAEHMYRMSMMVFMLKDPAIDKDRLLKICLVHDIAEALVGDITPHEESAISGQKQVMEVEAMRAIARIVSGQADLTGTNSSSSSSSSSDDSMTVCVLADELLSLWYEYEGLPYDKQQQTSSASSSSGGKEAPKTLTAESALAHQLDKLEMIVQADEYERAEQGAAKDGSGRGPAFLQDFFDSTASSFRHPEVLGWAELLRSQRMARIQQWEQAKADASSEQDRVK